MMTDTGWSTEFYTDARERPLAYEFIQSLEHKDHAAALRTLDLLVQYGPRLGKPYVKHIEGKLWELRPGRARLFYFLHTGRRFIILHGYYKKSRKTPHREIETAKSRMRHFLERE